MIECGRLAEGGAALPSSQLNRLREALLRGTIEGEAQFKMIIQSYAGSQVAALGAASSGDSTLFWKESSGPGGSEVQLTGALDAMDAVGFLMPSAPIAAAAPSS